MSESERVWYACYGSNLSYERFRCYLEGGTPAGSTRTCKGARDRTLPRRCRRWMIRHRLYFAKEVESWGGGGVAFVEREAAAAPDGERAAPGATYSKLHNISREQFLDVFAQENGRTPGTASIDFEELHRTGAYEVEGAGWYGCALYLGDFLGSPIYTFTTPGDLSGERKPPSEAYLKTIVRGILETFPVAEEWEKLEAYALAAIGDQADGTLVRKWVQECRAAHEERLVDQGLLRVRQTTKRGEASGDYIVRLGELAMLNRGLTEGSKVLLSMRHSRLDRPRDEDNVLRVPAFLAPCDDKIAPGEIQVDMKLRTALGVRPGDFVDVSVFVQSTQGKHRWLASLLKVQQQLMRPHFATFEDMEMPVCRIPTGSFEVMGIQPGDFVLIESIHDSVSLRALTLTGDVAKQRRADTKKDAEVKPGTYPDFRLRLGLGRFGTAEGDLPWIFIDAEARRKLGIELGDPVCVHRNPLNLLSKRAYLLTIPIVLGVATSILSIKLPAAWDLWVKLGLSVAGMIAVGSLTVWELRRSVR